MTVSTTGSAGLAPDPTRFILIGTSHPGNVGATARAMKVMGFSDLVLVRPRFADVLIQEETVALVHEIPGGSVPTLFACHLDTVHTQEGHQQVKSLRGRPGAMYSPDGECLGADDGEVIVLGRFHVLGNGKLQHFAFRNHGGGGCIVGQCCQRCGQPCDGP